MTEYNSQVFISQQILKTRSKGCVQIKHLKCVCMDFNILQKNTSHLYASHCL